MFCYQFVAGPWDADFMFERPINFARPRPMKCPACLHEWMADDFWLRDFNDGYAGCPNCNPTGDLVDQIPTVYDAGGSPLLDDDYVRSVYWYHTSTQKSWPDPKFNPKDDLSPGTEDHYVRNVSSAEYDQLIEDMKTRALHVGTYEAAIENMFRSGQDQNRRGQQFYLYRVQLDPSCRLEKGVQEDNKGSKGNVQMKDRVSDGANAFRYFNVHEDETSISLGVNVEAIARVQSIKIPLSIEVSDSTLSDFTRAVRSIYAETAEPKPIREIEPCDQNDAVTRLQHLWNQTRAPRTSRKTWHFAAEQAIRNTIKMLPGTLDRRVKFNAPIEMCEADIERVATQLEQSIRLFTEPCTVLRKLDGETWRTVSL